MKRIDLIRKIEEAGPFRMPRSQRNFRAIAPPPKMRPKSGR